MPVPRRFRTARGGRRRLAAAVSSAGARLKGGGGVPGHVVLAGGPVRLSAGLVQESTIEAARIIVSAGMGQVSPLTIEQLYEGVTRLSIAYISSTVEMNRQILETATTLRAASREMLAAYRNPHQAADIYLMIGLLSGICSYSYLDLGYADEAMTQARAAYAMGELAGHDGLRAWALGTRSLIARFQGKYADALGYVREGLQLATTGTALVRLRCGEGQTLAHMGEVEAVRFLDLAREAREHVNSQDIVSGLFTFSEAKQMYYSGSSLQWLPGPKNAMAAERDSVQAIQMFRRASPEKRSPGDVLLVHIYLGNSRLTLGEIEGSLEALRPVLNLPLQSRSSWQRKRMRQIALKLERGKFSDSKLAISAHEEVSSFIAGS
jgi:tetratricopeptide (TPR) repeat protein